MEGNVVNGIARVRLIAKLMVWHLIFKGISDTAVLILYPEKGVSKIQKAQMTSADGPNTRVIGVKSDFDFCQTTIKTIFNDPSFNKKLLDCFKVQLSAANSLNWGRLLPQVVYHASAYLDLVKSGVISMGEEADLCVPTGNFGNILAAYYVRVRSYGFRVTCPLGLQRYTFPRYDTYLDTRATIRYTIRYTTVRDKTRYQQLTLLLNNLFP